MESNIREAARALGRIKTEKKRVSSLRNLDKANAALDANARKERAKKAAAARWKDHTKKDDNK